MVNELVEVALIEATEKAKREVAGQARSLADERLLDILSPGLDGGAVAEGQDLVSLRADLEAGRLDLRKVKVHLEAPAAPLGMAMPAGMDMSMAMPPGMDELMSRLTEELGPSRKGGGGTPGKEMSVKEARRLLADEEAGKLLNMEKVKQQALESAENDGIIFVDEIDKIAAAGRVNTQSGSWSKGEGVQKELLGLLEGTTVRTKHGAIKTDHVLFICAGESQLGCFVTCCCLQPLLSRTH